MTDGKVGKFFDKKSVHLPGMRAVSRKTMTPQILDSSLSTTNMSGKTEKMLLRFQHSTRNDQITFFHLQKKTLLFSVSVREICHNPRMKMDLINRYLEPVCQVCSVHNLILKTLCSTADLFPARKCIDRECNSCGTEHWNLQ